MSKRRAGMEHFLIFTSRYKDKNQYITNRIANHLQARGKKVTTIVKEADWKSVEGEESEEAKNIPTDVDCMVVLGGDGTVLQAARETKKLHIPIIGVNLGTLGYMTEIEPSNLESALDKLIAGEYETESRMMLNGKVFFKDGREDEGWALNDIVISKSGSFQIINFNIYVNGQFLHDYKADGMIVTTPTGSTGYNLSAGGPLIEPKAKLITLTPICPHSLNHRSIILSSDDVIELVVPAIRDGQSQTVEANFDGTHKITLNTGDRIRIVQSEKTTEFLKINQVSFLEVLGRKMRDI
jgi:NAD+ kinase